MKKLFGLIAAAFTFMFDNIRLIGMKPVNGDIAQDRTEFVFESNFPHLSENGGGATCDPLGSVAAAA